MKTGQFVCLGTLQYLRNRFSSGYALQIKVSNDENVQQMRDELVGQLPGVEIEDQHNGTLFCNVPFASPSYSTSMFSSVAIKVNCTRLRL